MAKNKIVVGVALLGIAIAVGVAWWIQNRPTAAPPAVVGGSAGGPGPAAGGTRPGGGGGPSGPVAVEVGKVVAARLEDDAQVVGSLRALQSVVLRPEVSGRIQRLGFADGQNVKRGQLLLQLDDTLQQAQLKQAEAQAHIARTNLQRSRELAAQNFVSQSAVDQNAAALEVAQAQVALAQAQLQRMRVLAPFDATAGIRSVNVGDYVKDGADVVALEDTSALFVDFRLPERYVERIRGGHPVQAAVDALPGRSYGGRVTALDATVDANGRALLVRARLDNRGGELRPGMFARVRVVFDVRADALLVPEEALVPVGGKQYLFTVTDGPDGRKLAKRVEARVGLRIPGKAEILAGLKAGDLVVTAGHARLMRGDAVPVRVIDLDRPPGPPGAGASGAGARGASSPAGASAPRGATPA